MVNGKNDEFVGHIVFKLCSVAGIHEEGAEVDGTHYMICFGVEVVLRSLTNGFVYVLRDHLLWANADSVLDMDLAVQNILQFEVTGGLELADVSRQGDLNGNSRHGGNVAWGYDGS